MPLVKRKFSSIILGIYFVSVHVQTLKEFGLVEVC